MHITHPLSSHKTFHNVTNFYLGNNHTDDKDNESIEETLDTPVTPEFDDCWKHLVGTTLQTNKIATYKGSYIKCKKNQMDK
jgi:hypothetical protein